MDGLIHGKPCKNSSFGGTPNLGNFHISSIEIDIELRPQPQDTSPGPRAQELMGDRLMGTLVPKDGKKVTSHLNGGNMWKHYSHHFWGITLIYYI